MSAPPRIPFPVVDEVSRHCAQEREPETVHIEVHLPGHLDPGRMSTAFTEALRRHPRILVREARGPWYRRRYEWEVTDGPDVEVVSFPAPGRDALRDARARALTQAPPLTASPPVRLEVVEVEGRTEAATLRESGTRAHDGPRREASTRGHDSTRRESDTPQGAGTRTHEGTRRESDTRQESDTRRESSTRGHDSTRQESNTLPHNAPRQGTRTVLLLTVNHTALDGPACLRVLATAAELYGGRDNAPAAPPVRPPGTPEGPPDTPSPWVPPARVALGTPEPAPGNGLLVTELALPHRPKGSPYTVNDQLMVATALTVVHWNREHGAARRPLRITMPVDDRPRDTTMPIGNGTRLVDVPFAPEELDPGAMPELLRRTARRTRALKSLSRPQLGHGAALLTAPWAPVACRAALTRGLRRAAAPWTSTTLLSNIGRIPYPLDFGEEAGRAHAVWFSAPARMPRGLTVTTASTAGRLHLALRWSRTLLGPEDGSRLRELFAHYLHTTEAT